MSVITERPIIAIVDDDASIRRALDRLLFASGMETRLFASGQEFIDLIDTTPSFSPDCVILDIQMPGLTGFQVHKQLSWKRRNIPVIFVSGSEEAFLQPTLTSAAVAFFQKPLDTEMLLVTLRLLLGGGKTS